MPERDREGATGDSVFRGTRAPTNESRTQSLLTALLVASLPWSTLLVLGTSNLYLNNIDGFTLQLRDLLSYSIPLFLVATLGTTALLRLVKSALHVRLVSLLFAFSMLLWFQGNILVWQYGLLDGRQIIWGDYWLNGVIDGLIWLAVLAWSLVRPAPFYRAAPRVAGGLVALPLVALLVTSSPATRGDSHSLRDYAIDESGKFNFSKQKNVILIVVDETQSDVFKEIIEAEEEYAEIFQGFTYFRDALAGSNYTELAIPALLTGRIFDNSQTRSSFLERAYLDDSIMAVLRRRGYVVDIYPWVGWANESIFYDERIASNLKKIEARDGGSPYTEQKAKEVLQLIDLSLFRSAPHFLKRHIYNEQYWFLVDLASHAPRFLKNIVSTTDSQFEAGTFVSQLSTGVEATHGQPVFKYYHLKGAHSPLTVNQELKFTDQTFAYNRQNYTASVMASLRSLGVFFARLKGLGVFDDSLIIVVSDHGSGNSEEMYVGTSRDAAVVAESRRRGIRRSFGRDKARAIPILLVKRFGSQGPLETSEAPVSLLDVPATVFSILGVETSPTGMSVYEVDGDAVRTRRYGVFEYRTTSGDYVEPIVFYSVTGDSWLDQSWSIEDVSSGTRQGRFRSC